MRKTSSPLSLHRSSIRPLLATVLRGVVAGAEEPNPVDDPTASGSNQLGKCTSEYTEARSGSLCPAC